MRKLLVWTGTLLLLTCLGVGGWWAWPILFPALPSGWLSTLSKADAALLQERPDLARKVLSELPTSLPVSGWLAWEKRVNAVAVRTGAWAWASETAAVAQASYPGNPELSAYLVWTLLKAGEADKASSLASKVLAGTSWSGLAVQAQVEAEGLASGDWTVLKATLAEPSDEAFRAYEKLVAIDPEPALRKNALLAALSQGRLDEARKHLTVLTPEQRDQPPFDRLQGLMAYDQGDWSRAAALLKSLTKAQPETLLVLADVYLHLGDSAQARIIYDQLLADARGSVPASLVVNRATLALDDGQPGEALSLLSRADSLGTGQSLERIRLLILEARFLAGETEVVRQALDGILNQGPENSLVLEAELLKGRLFPDWGSAERLWSLLHRHPDFAPLAERLSWLMLASGDYDSAHRVLDMHEKALVKSGQMPAWWSRQLRALVLASEDRLPEASDAFQQVPPAWRDATFFANTALVAQVRGQRADAEARKPYFDDALERVTRALDLLPPSSMPEALIRRSRWLTRKGELELSLVPLQIPARRGALRSAATEDFRQAVQLDPDNLRASFLLRQATVTQETP